METDAEWLQRQLRQIWEQFDIQAKAILELEKIVNRTCKCTCHVLGHKFTKPDPIFFNGTPRPCCHCV